MNICPIVRSYSYMHGLTRLNNLRSPRIRSDKCVLSAFLNNECYCPHHEFVYNNIIVFKIMNGMSYEYQS